MPAVTYTSAGAISNVHGATYAALHQRFRDLAVVVDAVGAERQAIATEMRAREKEAGIKMRIGAMNADTKVLYRRVIDSP